MTSAVITGTGLYHPPHVISNAELVDAFNRYVDGQNAQYASDIADGKRLPLQRSSVEFIEKSSGIRQRYVLEKSGVLDPTRMYPRLTERSDDQLSLMAEIAVNAARQAMTAAGKSAQDIDLVICAAANMQRAYPAMAIEIQQALGARGYGFDMNVACSSATFGIEQASNAVLSGRARCVLMVNPEITSAHLEWRERDCHFIFGDVCTAVIIERSDTATADEQWEILGTSLATQFSNSIRNNFGFMNRSEDSSPTARDKTFRQDGRKVFTEVVPLASAHIENHLGSLDLKPTQVQRYWLHQANEGMNQQVIKNLVKGQAGDERAPLILGEYANTASAGSIIAFHRHRENLKIGDVGVICSFGAGYSIGSLVVRKRGLPSSRSVRGVHPLVHINTSVATALSFKSRFSGGEFFLNDHRVRGVRILPAAAHLEMVHASVVQLLGPITPVGAEPGITLLGVVFACPAALVSSALDVEVSFKPDDMACMDFEVGGVNADGQHVVFSQGRVSIASRREAPRCDPGQLREGARLLTWNAEQCYELFAGMGLDYGPEHRSLAGIEVGCDAQGQPLALAQLKLPQSLLAQHGDYVLHPSLLDAALQAGLSLLIHRRDKVGESLLALPYAVDRVEIFSPLTACALAIVRIEREGAGFDSHKLNIDVTDEQGQVCARLFGLSVRLVPGQAVITTESDVESEHAPVLGALTLAPIWSPCQPELLPTEALRSTCRRVVLGASSEAIAVSLWRERDPLSAFLAVSVTDDADGIALKLERLDRVDEIIWVPGSADACVDAASHGAIARTGFRLIKALFSLGYESRPLRLMVITTQAQAMSVDEPICPAQAAVHGLMGSLAKELPHWQIQLVDVDAESEGLAPIIQALPHRHGGNAMLYRSGQWYEPRCLPVAWPEQTTSGLRHGGVYVLLGGAGGLGEVFSDHLVQRYAAQVIWIGRRAEDHVITEKCDRIAVHGPRPCYLRADARDPVALRDAYQEIKRRFGVIHGVVNATIELQDNSLLRMDEATFNASLSAKVDVSVNVADVFAGEPLDFVLFFSSVQSLAKLPGQANYAAGCMFADAFAHWMARSSTCAIRVVNWGYWGHVGVVASQAYRDRMAQVGIDSIEVSEGLDLIEQLLASPLRQVVFIKTSKADVLSQLGVMSHEVLRPALGGAIHQDAQRLPMRVVTLPVDPVEVATQGRDFDRILCKLLRVQLMASDLFEGNRIEQTYWRRGTKTPALFDRWIPQSLSFIRMHDGDPSPSPQPHFPDAADVWQAWEHVKPRWLADPCRHAQVRLVDATLRALPAVLRGEIRATDIMFPQSSMSLVEGIYKNNPLADYFNAVLGEALLTTVVSRLENDPAARIRIVEIGAGTGGTSALVFDLLRPHAHQIEEYRYTDISRAFLMHAQEHYASKAPYLVTGLFNAERELAGQGLDEGAYDIAIATNVLHATQDVRTTLRNTKALLKPGGVLLLNEIVGASVLTHLTFGLLDGWWLYRDEALRCPGAPALSPSSWGRALHDEGFDQVTYPAEAAHGLGQQVIVARSNGVVRQPGMKRVLKPSAF